MAEKNKEISDKGEARPQRNFLREVFVGYKKPKSSEKPNGDESALGDGVSVEEFERMLEDFYNPKIKLKRPERGAVAEDYAEKYSGKVTTEKVADYVGDLGKVKRKDDPKVKEKIKLLEEFFKPK